MRSRSSGGIFSFIRANTSLRALVLENVLARIREEKFF